MVKWKDTIEWWKYCSQICKFRERQLGWITKICSNSTVRLVNPFYLKYGQEFRTPLDAVLVRSEELMPELDKA